MALAQESTALESSPVATDPDEGLTSARERARQLFIQASDHAVRADWVEAARLYEASYAIEQHASTLLNIGLCYERLGRPSAALSYILQAVRAPGDGDRGVDEVKARELEQRLLRSLGAVRLQRSGDTRDAAPNVQVEGLLLRTEELSDGQQVIIPTVAGEQRVPWASGSVLLLEPGRYELTLTLDGDKAINEIAVAPEQATTLIWSANAAVPPSVRETGTKEKDHPKRPLAEAHTTLDQGLGTLQYGAYAAFAVSAIGAGLGIGYGLEAQRLERNLSGSCDEGRCSVARRADVDDYKRAATWSNVGAAVGAGSLLVALTLLALADSGEPPLVASEREVRWAIPF